MDDVLRPLIVVGGSVVLTLLLGWATDRLLRKADERHHETPLWGLLRRARVPYQLLLCAVLLRASYDETRLLTSHDVAVGRILTLVLIGSAAWLTIRIAAAVVETSYTRYATNHRERDPARVRRVRTQVTLIRRVVSAAVGVVAVAAMLLTFPAMRAAAPRCWPRRASSASSPVWPPSRRWATCSPDCRSRSATWCASATPWWWTASGAPSRRSPSPS